MNPSLEDYFNREERLKQIRDDYWPDLPDGELSKLRMRRPPYYTSQMHPCPNCGSGGPFAWYSLGKTKSVQCEWCRKVFPAEAIDPNLGKEILDQAEKELHGTKGTDIE